MSFEAHDQLRKRTFQPGQWPLKTIDVGANGVTVSANPLGQIYQISSPLDAGSKYGIMVAAPWDQFDHRQRTNPNYVREFRKRPEKMLIEQGTGLGLDFGGVQGPVVTRQVQDSIGSHAQFEYQAHGGASFVQTALKVNDDGTITHASKVTNMTVMNQIIPVTLDLEFAVSRAGYGQLTDRGEVAMPDPENVLKTFPGTNGAGVLGVWNRSLGGWMLVHIIFYNETTQQHIEVDGSLFPWPGVQQNPPARSIRRLIQEIFLGPGETLKLVVSFRPGNDAMGEEFDSFSEVEWADEVGGDELFSRQDGTHHPGDVEHRHLAELDGFSMDRAETIESIILWTNVNYILGCCCVPLSGPQGDGTCCVADHFALNLGWPRDNYWQMRVLMKLDGHTLARLLPNNLELASQYEGKIRHALTTHLTWLFKMAVTSIEINGRFRYFWRRSYLVNGMPKDGEVYQLDTQCYPFLEVCEYFEAFREEPQTRYIIQSILMTESFNNILLDLLSRQDGGTNLFASDETPADDDLGEYQFHLSSNILLWRTLRKLGKLLSRQEFRHLQFPGVVPPRSQLASAAVTSEILNSIADVTKESILRNFISRHAVIASGGDLQEIVTFAYAFDPTKHPEDPTRFRHYHDGNDLPTLYAQEWGLLQSERGDEGEEQYLSHTWQRTMFWALTPGAPSAGANPGYKGFGTERFHGLGSDHSPGQWTLGFFQEWRFAQMVGDAAREDKAWAQIRDSAQFDGTFSEAVDIDTGLCTSKTWFSWPGAMIAENLIETVVGQVEDCRVG
ncbi:hypothetical protein DHEL01_v209428 [Diaporthe helianthi]|uniref:Six-hairpin glycosidase-like protein n=1 Tax=Diaporthe helianthi TaxID=158607 RepID=A0A2P5HPK1_DIAHE|nr:hypothetical protein DHEL01_v209428 [Diaporthe helianthi]